MALDTRTKRASAALPLLPFYCRAPGNDGTIDAGDRGLALFLYSGIIPGWTAELAATVPDFTSGLAGTYGPTGALAATVPPFASSFDGIGGIIATGGSGDNSKSRRKRREERWAYERELVARRRAYDAPQRISAKDRPAPATAPRTGRAALPADLAAIPAQAAADNEALVRLGDMAAEPIILAVPAKPPRHDETLILLMALA